MYSTNRGETPLKGSSNKINFDSVFNKSLISKYLNSPPDNSDTLLLFIVVR